MVLFVSFHQRQTNTYIKNPIAQVTVSTNRAHKRGRMGNWCHYVSMVTIVNHRASVRRLRHWRPN